jgi:transcriptional regulator
MIISRFTKSELDFLRQECNFVNLEIEVFEGRAKGKSQENIAEECNISIDCVRKISTKVNAKIKRVLK